MLPLILLLIVIFTVIIFLNHQKRKKFKQDVVYPVLKEFFSDLEYGHMKGFDKRRIYDTKLVSSGNRYRSDDYIKATYHGMDFEFADVVIQNETRTNDTTHTTTYFRGQWIIVKPKRKIQGRLYVIDNRFRHSNPKGFLFFKDKSLEEVNMESELFNEEFNVYAESSHEAFYMLNPQMLLRLKAIHDEDVSFYFNGSSLHIAIYSNKLLFEPRLFDKVDIEQHRDSIKESLLDVLKYVDVFEVEKE